MAKYIGSKAIAFFCFSGAQCVRNNFLLIEAAFRKSQTVGNGVVGKIAMATRSKSRA